MKKSVKFTTAVINEVHKSIQQSPPDPKIVKRDIAEAMDTYFKSNLSFEKETLKKWVTLMVCLSYNKAYLADDFDPDYYGSNVRSIRQDIKYLESLGASGLVKVSPGTIHGK